MGSSHFCVNDGSRLEPREIEGRLLEACPNCDFVLWRDPKVVTMVVVVSPRGIVLGRRGIEPAYGAWCLPGGFVNDDEDPAESARRECLEEIGSEVIVERLLGVHHIAKRGAPSMIGIAYQARLAEGAEPFAGSEMLEVGYFSPASLPELAFPSHRQAMNDWSEAGERSEKR